MSKFVTPAIQKTFKKWEKNLEDAIKTGFNESNSHLLQSPSSVLTNLHNQKWNPKQIFTLWSSSALISYKGTLYLKLLKETKKKLPTEKPLAIIKSYSDPSKRTKKMEENSLTLLHEAPSQNRIASKKGNLVEKWLDRPCIISEAEIPETSLLKGAAQEYITPLGKKGILAFHTGNQYSSLNTLNVGEFQRFFLASSPHAGITRVAHTIVKLAQADPKSVTQTAKKLTELFNQNLKSFGESLLWRIKHHTLHIQNWETHFQEIDGFHAQLPQILLKKGSYRMTLKLCADKAYGYTFQTAALSLKTDNPNTDPQYTQQSFKEIWAVLQKN